MTKSHSYWVPIVKNGNLDVKNSLKTKKNMLGLSEKYYLVVGDRFELFYRGVIQAVNPYNYHINLFYILYLFYNYQTIQYYYQGLYLSWYLYFRISNH